MASVVTLIIEKNMKKIFNHDMKPEPQVFFLRLGMMQATLQNKTNLAVFKSKGHLSERSREVSKFVPFFRYTCINLYTIDNFNTFRHSSQ
jgi:predicted transcriptional regulator